VKIKQLHVPSIVHGDGTRTTPSPWVASADGTHVPLPLDGEVPDAVVDAVTLALSDAYDSWWRTSGVVSLHGNMARAAIAALAAKLGEVEDE
jgi:hypothetical protein